MSNTLNHTISVKVANKPGVLLRIATIFARRGFNIDSLVVSPALDGKYSRMTITTSGARETLEQIIKQLNKLNPDKCPGPDMIHPRILKDCRYELALPLYIIFRKSLDTGELPTTWKTAAVTPIFKSGSRTQAKNYRPISLTAVACKVLESLVRDKVQEHLDNSQVMSEHQHGFCAGKSCLTNLLETLEKITELIDHGQPVDILFLDYQKAFDSVPHRRLLWDCYIN